MDLVPIDYNSTHHLPVLDVVNSSKRRIGTSSYSARTTSCHSSHHLQWHLPSAPAACANSMRRRYHTSAPAATSTAPSDALSTSAMLQTPPPASCSPAWCPCQWLASDSTGDAAVHAGAAAARQEPGGVQIEMRSEVSAKNTESAICTDLLSVRVYNELFPLGREY